MIWISAPFYMEAVYARLFETASGLALLGIFDENIVHRTWLALCNETLESGCIWLLPGSCNDALIERLSPNFSSSFSLVLLPFCSLIRHEDRSATPRNPHDGRLPVALGRVSQHNVRLGMIVVPVSPLEYQLCFLEGVKLLFFLIIIQETSIETILPRVTRCDMRCLYTKLCWPPPREPRGKLRALAERICSCVQKQIQQRFKHIINGLSTRGICESLDARGLIHQSPSESESF